MKQAIIYFSILLLALAGSCQLKKAAIADHVNIDVYAYEYENEVKGAAMPEIKTESKLMPYKRRFEYILLNMPEIHQPEKARERSELFGLYPDTAALQKRYLEKLSGDKKLRAYFEETLAPIEHPQGEAGKTYTADELMEVASKFFYCDLVNPDTTVQSHVCVGINGLREVQWQKDYTLLAAFCYEAIFHDFDRDVSPISEAYDSEKKKACQKYRPHITSLDRYLEDVKLELFERMRNDAVLKKELLDYYESNKDKLAFKLTK